MDVPRNDFFLEKTMKMGGQVYNQSLVAIVSHSSLTLGLIPSLVRKGEIREGQRKWCLDPKLISLPSPEPRLVQEGAGPTYHP